MRIELPALLSPEQEALLSGRMTPAMAAEYLKGEQIVLRTFSEVLRDMYPYADLQSKLTAALAEFHPELLPESASRRVRNWLGGRNHPVSREDIFLIAFTLGLSEQQADRLLGFCTDYGIHYRDGRDVVYAWFLRAGKPYRQARDFFHSLPPIPHESGLPHSDLSHLTLEIRNSFLLVKDEDSLRKCYEEKLPDFGALHMRAYHYFEQYLRILIHPDGNEEERDYSLETVMQTYLSLSMPSGKKRKNYSLVQRLLKQGWPNTTLLKNIRLHKEDVSRKLLILLYVVTENAFDEAEGEYEEEPSLQVRVEDHWWTLNAILTDCGMPALDLRNAWDWLALYALTAGPEESMSERMQQVIEEIFADLQ